MGAHVIVTEIDPLRALEAAMDGYQVLPMIEAAKIGDIFCTVTGDKHVIARDHFQRMKDGAVVANTGHFNVEIDIAALRELAAPAPQIRPVVEEFMLPDGRRIYLLAEGRLVNLAAAEGHPAAVMDMSASPTRRCRPSTCSQKARSARAVDVYAVPPAIDREVARLKLRAIGVEIDVADRGPARLRRRLAQRHLSRAPPDPSDEHTIGCRGLEISRASGRAVRRPAPRRCGPRAMGSPAPRSAAGPPRARGTSGPRGPRARSRSDNHGCFARRARPP